ncbi:hypothetical protein EWI61_03020 [Methylolobus aquaticus]|nr:hypothetical protein EWI61_03020 [Methylolobus aquaticus]
MQQTRQTLLIAVVIALTGPCGAIEVNARNPPPAELYGTYGPRGNCSASPRVSVDETGLYVVIGQTRGRVDGLDLCLSCAGGARYEGIEQWLSPRVEAAQGYAVNFRFNADEKPGQLIVNDTGDTALGPNLKSVVAASPYQRCGPPTRGKPAR